MVSCTHKKVGYPHKIGQIVIQPFGLFLGWSKRPRLRCCESQARTLATYLVQLYTGSQKVKPFEKGFTHLLKVWRRSNLSARYGRN